MNRRRLVGILPQALTVSGIFFAIVGIVWAPEHPYWACNAIIAASLCDMLDGRVARLTGTTSAFGAELDSLADMVAFGVAPSLIIYLWRLSGPAPLSGFDPWLLPVFAFAACGAIRLARFNVSDSEDGYEFTGIPMPVGALLPIAACMAYHEIDLTFLGEKLVLAVLLITSGLLMVSRLRVPAYKRFRSRLRKGLYYGAIAGGCSLLLVGGPGGTVLLVLLLVYLSVAMGKAVARRLSSRERPAVS